MTTFTVIVKSIGGLSVQLNVKTFSRWNNRRDIVENDSTEWNISELKFFLGNALKIQKNCLKDQKQNNLLFEKKNSKSLTRIYLS